MLVIIIPITQLMASLNNSIVEIFATQVDWSDSARIANHGGLIAGIIIEIIYFFIGIYLNFVYLMRSLMIAILIASGPFFVVTMAFSVKGKGLFDNWFKELVANIYLQGFHAFAFAFVLNVQGATRGIEEIAMAASLIPLTEFFRTMVFGQAGNFAIKQGKGIAVQGTQMATKLGDSFSSSSKNGSSKSSGDKKEKLDDTNNVKQNSEKLSGTSKLGKVAGVTGAVMQKTYDASLALAKTGAGLAYGDTSLTMDGTTDFRNMIQASKNDISNRIGNSFMNTGDVNYDKNGVLGFRETGTSKQPIRSKTYLQNERGLDFVGHKGGGFTLLVKNRDKLNSEDTANLQELESNWSNPNIDRNLFLKKNGIDNILTNTEGRITSIGYNKSSLKNLNLAKIQEKDHFGEKALYEDRINNKLEPKYTFKPMPVYKLTEDNVASKETNVG